MNLKIQESFFEKLEIPKSLHYKSIKRNDEVHEYHLGGINSFCGTHFGSEENELIYTFLGNRINHRLTIEFIRSEYDMGCLNENI